MICCTFFGHRCCPADLHFALRKTILYMITERNVTKFYVGTCEGFDWLSYQALCEIVPSYPGVTFETVLSRIPDKSAGTKRVDSLFTENTIVPEGLERVPPRFGISFRNRWMLSRSQFVIAYVNRLGGAETFVSLALRQNKTVVNLASQNAS